jgi:hypothetical protein
MRFVWAAATVILLLAVALLYFRGEPGCELAGGNTLYLSRLGAETMRARFCYAAADCRLVAEQMTKAAAVEALEGRHDGVHRGELKDHHPAPVVPTFQGFHAFWGSPDYVPVKKIREGAASLDVWAVAGVQ